MFVVHETRMLPCPVAEGRSFPAQRLRIIIPGLQIRAQDSDPVHWEWLLDPLCPFDLTALRHADYGDLRIFSFASRLLELLANTIERLTICPGTRMYPAAARPCIRQLMHMCSISPMESKSHVARGLARPDASYALSRGEHRGRTGRARCTAPHHPPRTS
ncbi:hypothetical protein FB451DRAFT_1255461 [Mycena latifolia]|nr:hypothetical protein FB451DRAFT_1255461 [Mycena latifolia]